MCGIAGFVSFNNLSLNQKNILTMLDSLNRRGPEGTSWLEKDFSGEMNWINKKMRLNPLKKLKMAIGCSRLAINDISELGLQPIPSNSKHYWVVLNGEIFNFLEIKKELINLGYKFKSKTDTEVVANSFEEWGKECFKKFNGQFSIVIFDVVHERLILARDRIGIAPLYFYKDDNKFIFSSETNSILQILDKKQKLNKSRIMSYISLPYKLHLKRNETLLREIYQVEPGYILDLEIKTKKINEKSYWKINDFKERNEDFVFYKEKLIHTLTDSIRIRLRTDRKLAYIISGGIDSSATLGITKKVFNYNPSTFSLDLPDSRFNENESINDTVKQMGLEHNYIQVNPKIFFEHLKFYEKTMDLPLATPNSVLHIIMANTIKSKNINVVLNGVGGDEIFFGYHDHFLYNLYNLNKKGSNNFDSEINSWIQGQSKSRVIYNNFVNYIESKSEKISPDFLSRSNNFDYRTLIEDKSIISNSLIQNLNYSIIEKKIKDITNFTLPYALRMDDHCYFSKSVEARQPFLDHRIIELGISTPQRFMIKRGYSKFILRQAMKKFIPFARRNDKKKIGLNLPFDVWIKNDLKKWIEENTLDKKNPIFEFANYKETQKIIKQHMSDEKNHSLKLWDLSNLNVWLTKNKNFLQNA